MNIVLNIKESQLPEVLEVLAGTAGTAEIVINIKEEETKERHPTLTTEDLQRIHNSVEAGGEDPT